MLKVFNGYEIATLGATLPVLRIYRYETGSPPIELRKVSRGVAAQEHLFFYFKREKYDFHLNGSIPDFPCLEDSTNTVLAEVFSLTHRLDKIRLEIFLNFTLAMWNSYIHVKQFCGKVKCHKMTDLKVTCQKWDFDKDPD